MNHSLKTIFLFLALSTTPTYSQDFGVGAFDFNDDDLNIGGNIFSDFDENMESSKILEDERFYRYGRFFGVHFGIGHTQFTGNRGLAYDNPPPTFGFGMNYFFNFQNSLFMGFNYSQHTFLVDTPTNGFAKDEPGILEINLFRAFLGYRYYIDTFDLGTAITYANPYFTGKFEYWYKTDKFLDNKDNDFSNTSDSSLAFAVGGGFEFPIEIKESYLNVEVLLHFTKFNDTYTTDYQALDSDDENFEEGIDYINYDDLSGYGVSFVAYYVLSW